MKFTMILTTNPLELGVKKVQAVIAIRSLTTLGLKETKSRLDEVTSANAMKFETRETIESADFTIAVDSLRDAGYILKIREISERTIENVLTEALLLLIKNKDYESSKALIEILSKY